MGLEARMRHASPSRVHPHSRAWFNGYINVGAGISAVSILAWSLTCTPRITSCLISHLPQSILGARAPAAGYVGVCCHRVHAWPGVLAQGEARHDAEAVKRDLFSIVAMALGHGKPSWGIL